MTKKIVLILTSIWWGWTALVDFAIVPTVFRTIPDFFQAGELGIALFSKLNLFELVIATALVIACVYQLRIHKQGKIQLIASLCAWVIVIFYVGYLTDKLIELTDLWMKADASNQVGIAGIIDIQQEHQYYHRVYVGLDSLKLLCLTFMLAAGLWERKSVHAKT